MKYLLCLIAVLAFTCCSQQEQVVPTHRSPDDIHRYTTVYEENRIITYEPYSAKNAEVKEHHCKPTPNQETSVSWPQFHTLSDTERLAPTINFKNYNRKFNLYNSNAKARSKSNAKSTRGGFSENIGSWSLVALLVGILTLVFYVDFVIVAAAIVMAIIALIRQSSRRDVIFAWITIGAVVLMASIYLGLFISTIGLA